MQAAGGGQGEQLLLCSAKPMSTSSPSSEMCQFAARLQMATSTEPSAKSVRRPMELMFDDRLPRSLIQITHT